MNPWRCLPDKRKIRHRFSDHTCGDSRRTNTRTIDIQSDGKWCSGGGTTVEYPHGDIKLLTIYRQYRAAVQLQDLQIRSGQIEQIHGGNKTISHRYRIKRWLQLSVGINHACKHADNITLFVLLKYIVIQQPRLQSWLHICQHAINKGCEQWLIIRRMDINTRHLGTGKQHRNHAVDAAAAITIYALRPVIQRYALHAAMRCQYEGICFRHGQTSVTITGQGCARQHN